MLTTKLNHTITGSIVPVCVSYPKISGAIAFRSPFLFLFWRSKKEKKETYDNDSILSSKTFLHTL